ncbi:hypothetical protein NDU88_004586 [Pleurodeles waltl]|uniref:Uncharacterized protein n=1 Tax=Pleurodeles waltl TaxID=8319 RepID=A0AAV7RJ65_PLEWA|nr:hypothetical protein NDU88_004586 [Pleurodeles waltl]
MGPEKSPAANSSDDQDLRQILVTMQQNLTQIDGKIDLLSYRMDRMSECLDKYAEHLDQAERRVSEVEDGQTELATGKVKLNKELSALRLKVQEARRQFLAGKKLLRSMHLEYRMLYSAKLRVEVDGSPIFFSYHKKLVKHRIAVGGSGHIGNGDS